MTQVVNIRNAPEGWENDPQYVYIGRQSPWHRPKPLKRSKWCNPFVIQNPTEAERQQVIVQFEEHLMNSPELIAALTELVGKTLVCYCKPKACHGDVLVKYVQLMEEGSE